MTIQVVSDIGDDVYATVSTEEDAIRIDNAMNILLRGDASRIRANPSDPAISEFARTHGFDKIEDVEELLQNISIAVSGQDDKFVLSDRIVPFIRYFFGNFKSYYDDGDLNFFTTLAALTTKERQTLVNGFRTLSKNNAFGGVSSAHNSTANLQTLYIFLKLLPKDRHLGMSRLFGSLNSENTLHEFFNEYDHYSKYQSLPITIEVLNAAVDKFLNFEITLPFFVDSELASVIKDNERTILNNKEPYTDILGVKISRKDFESSVYRFRTFFANAKSFNDKPKKAIDDIIYYVGYISPHTFRKENPFTIKYLTLQKEVFYSVSLLCYILASSGEMYERLKETNVSASNCIKRILEAKAPSIEPSEIFDLFCRENFKPNSSDFFKRGFMLYAVYYDLRARPEPQKITQTLFDRLLFEAYDANLEFINNFYNLIFVEKIDLFNKPISNVVDFKIIKYLSSHLPVRSLDRIYASGRIPSDFDMRNAFYEIANYENSWREIYRDIIERVRDDSIRSLLDGKSPKSIQNSAISELKRELNSHLVDLKTTLESEDLSDSIFDTDAALTFVNDLIAIDRTMMSVFESIHNDPKVVETVWNSHELIQNEAFNDLVNLYSPLASGVRRALSYLFEFFQDESEIKSVNQSRRIGNFSLTRLSKFNPLILAVGLKEVSNCCMIYGSVGFTCCLDAFSSDDSQVYVLYDHDLEIFYGSTYAFPGDSIAIVDIQGIDESESRKPRGTYTCDQIELSFDASTKSSEYISEVANNFIEMFYYFAVDFDEDAIDTVIINLSDAGGLPSDYEWHNDPEIVPHAKTEFLDDSFGEPRAKPISTQRNETYQDISSRSSKVLYICHPDRTTGYCTVDYEHINYCEGCDEYTAEEVFFTGYESLCESCSRQCSECSEVKPKDEIYGLAGLCEDCGKDCSGCNDFKGSFEFGDDPSGELCDECYEEEDDDEDDYDDSEY